MDRPANAIEAVALTKRYGAQAALHMLTADIPVGEVVGLLGHNGAGKTTFIKLALGLMRPDGGRLTVLGESPARAAASWRKRVGYLPENVIFYDGLTGTEFITYLETLKRSPRGHGIALLRQVGLEAAADKPVKTYSKGMRQRLGLAQALLGSPELLLLDEPTTGLDPDAVNLFYEIIARLRAAGRTVVISSHLLSELEPHIDRAIILNRGTLVRHGTVAELREDAGLPVTLRVRILGGGDLSRAPWLSGLDARAGNDAGVIELSVPAMRKMEIVRRLASDANVVDVEIRQPTLASLYDKAVGPAAHSSRER